MNSRENLAWFKLCKAVVEAEQFIWMSWREIDVGRWRVYVASQVLEMYDQNGTESREAVPGDIHDFIEFSTLDELRDRIRHLVNVRVTRQVEDELRAS